MTTSKAAGDGSWDGGSVEGSGDDGDGGLGRDLRQAPRTEGGVGLCGGCRRTGACQLGVTREWHEPEVSRFSASCPPNYEGGPDVAHGAWTSAVFDECLGHVPNQRGVMSVTAELTISFVKPVPVGRPLEVSVTVDRVEGRRWYIRGEMVLLPGRAVLARAQGIWVARDPEHFARHQNWLAEQDAAAVRAEV